MMKSISIPCDNAIRIYNSINSVTPNKIKNNLLSAIAYLIEDAVYNNMDDIVMTFETAEDIKKFLKTNQIDLLLDESNDKILSGMVKMT